MKQLQKILSICFVLCLFLSMAYSQKVGSTSMQFLKIIPSARGAALGDAYSTWSTGADAVFWNPSGLALLKNQEFNFSYLNWIADTRHGAFSYGMPFDDFGVLAVHVLYVDYGEIEEAIWAPPQSDRVIEPGLTGRTFRPFGSLFGLTYARSLTDKFSMGLSIKYAYESLYDGSKFSAKLRNGSNEMVKTWADVIMYDFGIRYNTGFRSVEIGASVQNFGPNVTFAKESHPIPMLFRWGIAGNIIGKEALFGYSDDNRIAAAFDLFQPNDYAQQEHVGIEYEYAEMFALRAGYKFNYDSESYTFGGGVKQTIGMTKISIDYAYGSIGVYLGNVHRISLGVGLQ